MAGVTWLHRFSKQRQSRKLNKTNLQIMTTSVRKKTGSLLWGGLIHELVSIPVEITLLKCGSKSRGIVEIVSMQSCTGSGWCLDCKSWAVAWRQLHKVTVNKDNAYGQHSAVCYARYTVLHWPQSLRLWLPHGIHGEPRTPRPRCSLTGSTTTKVQPTHTHTSCFACRETRTRVDDSFYFHHTLQEQRCQELSIV